MHMRLTRNDIRLRASVWPIRVNDLLFRRGEPFFYAFGVLRLVSLSMGRTRGFDPVMPMGG